MLARFSRNSLSLLTARLAAQLGFALFTILLARQLGSAAFGEYAFIAAVVLVGNVVTTFGTDMYLIREIAASGDHSLLACALWIQLLLSVVFIASVFLASSFLRALASDAIMAMRISALSLIPLAFFTVYTTALRGRQDMLQYAALNLALIALQIAAIFSLIWLRGGLVELAILLLLVQCAAAALAARLARVRLSMFAVRISAYRQVAGLIRGSAPIALLAIIGILYQRLSLLMLPSLAGPSVSGWFSAAARVVEAAKMGHLAAFTALYPLMAQARSKTASDFARTFRWSWWLLLAAASIAAVLISSFAASIVAVLYGSAYAGSGSLLRIIAWCLVPYSVNGFLALVFLARGQVTALLRASAIATLALGALTSWLVPNVGPTGAGLAALGAEIIQAIVLGLEYLRAGRSVAASLAPRYDLSTQA